MKSSNRNNPVLNPSADDKTSGRQMREMRPCAHDLYLTARGFFVRLILRREHYEKTFYI